MNPKAQANAHVHNSMIALKIVLELSKSIVGRATVAPVYKRNVILDSKHKIAANAQVSTVLVEHLSFVKFVPHLILLNDYVFA